MKKLKTLSRQQLKHLHGGYVTWCRRRSTNIEDIRGGSTTQQDEGFLNQNGCWVYADMPFNAHPDCSPSKASYTFSMYSGSAC
jgi:hypothetical protein